MTKCLLWHGTTFQNFRVAFNCAVRPGAVPVTVPNAAEVMFVFGLLHLTKLNGFVKSALISSRVPSLSCVFLPTESASDFCVQPLAQSRYRAVLPSENVVTSAEEVMAQLVVVSRRWREDVMPLVSAERGLFGRRTPGVAAARIEDLAAPPGFADEIVSALEARALWARYGL